MNGPSDKTLASLAGMLPSMIIGRNNGKFQPMPGGKSCPACGKLFGRPRKNGEILRAVCKPWKKVLDAGGVIFVSTDNRVLSIVPKPDGSTRINPKWAGKIMQIPSTAMDQLMTSNPPPT